MLPPYDADDAVLKGTKLEPAIQKLFKKQITLDKGDPSAFHAIDPQRAKSKAFYVLGYFVYRDQIGRSYRTAFCRRYRPQIGIFKLSAIPIMNTKIRKKGA
jgi:hypothetical protein